MHRGAVISTMMALAPLAATAQPAATQVAVTGRGGSFTRACAGLEATVAGNANQVTFVGPCSALRIDGSENVVVVDLARTGTIRITGDKNRVVFTPAVPAPVTTLRGYYNEVTPGPAAPSPTSLILDGSLGRRDVRCDGLDVIVRESDARYVLRGGCRSLTVEGQRVTIAAELLPAARLVIGGVGVVVNYVLTGEGAPPVVVVTAPGAKATHMARFGESAFMLPTVSGAVR